MPDSTLSRRSAALLRLLLRKTHKFHTETAEEPFLVAVSSIVIGRWGATEQNAKPQIQTGVLPTSPRH